MQQHHLNLATKLKNTYYNAKQKHGVVLAHILAHITKPYTLPYRNLFSASTAADPWLQNLQPKLVDMPVNPPPPVAPQQHGRNNDGQAWNNPNLNWQKFPVQFFRSEGPDRRPEGGEWESLKILQENKANVPNSTRRTSLLTAKVTQVKWQAQPRNG